MPQERLGRHDAVLAVAAGVLDEYLQIRAEVGAGAGLPFHAGIKGSAVRRDHERHVDAVQVVEIGADVVIGPFHVDLRSQSSIGIVPPPEIGDDSREVGEAAVHLRGHDPPLDGALALVELPAAEPERAPQAGDGNNDQRG